MEKINIFCECERELIKINVFSQSEIEFWGYYFAILWICECDIQRGSICLFFVNFRVRFLKKWCFCGYHTHESALKYKVCAIRIGTIPFCIC
jgi:hypothetical protein